MTSTKDTSDQFEKVLAEFKDGLTPRELNSFQFVTWNDVRETVLKMQRDQENLKAVMNMTRVESFLEGMNQFGKVIDVFVNASSFVAFVWGPLKFILQTASTFADTFEILLDAYSQLGEHMPLLEQYQQHFGSNHHMRRILPLMYADILEFHKRAVHFFRGKTTVWRQLFRSMWKNYGTRFKSIVNSLQRHKDLIREQMTLLHYEASQSISQELFRHTQNYDQDRLEALRRLENEEEINALRQNHEVLEWFSATDATEEDHISFREIRNQNPGSGQWILKDEKVQNWMELEIPESSVLWINGIPGSGKTILASAIIEDCLLNHEYKTSYFYCKENDEERNSCISIYRGLLKQHLKHCSDLVPHCYDKTCTSGESILTSMDVAQQLLLLFCEKIPKQYIIIDGLDECDPVQRKLVTSFFTKMVDKFDEQEPDKLRVLFVSQEYPDIEKSLRTATILKLTAESNSKDIKTYVRKWCRKIQVKHGLYNDKLEMVQYIEESTCIRAKGMFLFAKLVMDNLHAQERQKDLLDEIEVYKFPNGLEDAYERIISRLRRNSTGPQWRIACKLLGWMVCAKRPLKWYEIQAVVSMDLEKQTIEFESGQLRSNIQDYCGSLIQVLPGNRIELVHITAKIYITLTEWFHKSIVECNLAAICLRYLTFECFHEKVNSERLQYFASEGFLSFQDYAVAKWQDHVYAIIKTTPDILSANSGSRKALEDIEVALEEFVGCYDDAMVADDIVNEAETDCQPFKEYTFHHQLLLVWNHIYRHHQKGREKRNDISLETLSKALFRNREVLESLPIANGSRTSNADYLTAFYGQKRFKCPKIMCFYFHEGFKDGRDQKTHKNAHDRPFNCTFPDCSIAEFGFPTNKEMEKHVKLYHPEVEHQATTFTIEKPPPSEARYQCDICNKKFTRSFILRNHKRSHAGEKPFPCSDCGKAFTRSNDRTRHERIHFRR